MPGFAGFPTGKNPYVPIPEVFFTHLLPEIEDQNELKVTLHLFWTLAQKPNSERYVSDHELFTNQLLLRSLKRRGDPRPPEEHVRQGLEQAVARGTLLRVYFRFPSDDAAEPKTIGWYFFNTSRSRKIVAELEGGEVIPARLLNEAEPDEAELQVSQENEKSVVPVGYANGRHTNGKNVQVEIQRPNIFVLYEQNIGLLSPLIADDLRDAEDRYPAEWIEAAFREALQHNKRRWSYIHAILRRWETEGRQ